ncbi:MAG: sigma-54-dependent Fis family transcriptional regulator [Deltaproteobacteria bacterium]|nr:sigma-54-dependent Fis family transcriptional regulator [Deltaproteobacteria bacterium]
MKPKNRLTGDQREFFSLVNEAVFANPFSDRRVEIDLKIAGLFPHVSRLKRVAKTIEEVKAGIKNLEQQDKADINLFTGKDRSLIKNAFIFDFFYQFRNRFDQLILDQIRSGDVSIQVPFAHEAFSFLQKRGFNSKHTRHYIALSYQLRRAFFFIDRTIVGRSPTMKELRLNLWNNVFTHDIDLYERYLWNRMEDFSTLILGETGTGKGTAAMAIGRSGFIPFDENKERFVESFTKSFVSLNLSQFPETLIESELFGHKKGAFTGAMEEHKGVLSLCSPYGSILLDEIGEVSIPVQIKLLQVLQERVFSPVGSHQKERFQGRVIAATNRSINEIREKAIFRDDFYYRLCSDIITVPPLRRRIREDASELDDLLARTVERMTGKPSQELTGIVREVIHKKLGRDYPWPGNVRELEQCVRRVLLKRNYEGDDKSVSPDLRSRLVEGLTSGNIDAQSLIAGYCRLLYQRHGTFEEVARRTRLDRRTVKKYIHYPNDYI